MNVKKQQSTQQKTILKKAPQLLAALLLIGILSTQINNDKEIEEVENLAPVESIIESEVETAIEEKIETQEMTVVDQPPAKLLEEERVAAPVQKKINRVASPTSTVQTRSAVAYTSIKMELDNYTGKLRWGSSFQRNIKKFIVERSTDDEAYTEIGSIAGEGPGEHSQNKSYEFKDDDLMMVQMPRIFYRIKQQGTAGDSDYSDVIEYDLGLPEGLYASIEVDSKKKLHIQYSAPQSGLVNYTIKDAFGEPVSEGELQGEFDPQSFVLEANSWNKGTYYLELEAGKHSLTEPFSVK